MQPVLELIEPPSLWSKLQFEACAKSPKPAGDAIATALKHGRLDSLKYPVKVNPTGEFVTRTQYRWRATSGDPSAASSSFFKLYRWKREAT